MTAESVLLNLDKSNGAHASELPAEPAEAPLETVYASVNLNDQPFRFEYVDSPESAPPLPVERRNVGAAPLATQAFAFPDPAAPLPGQPLSLEDLHAWALSQSERLKLLLSRAFPLEEAANWAREAAVFLLQYREHASAPTENLTLPAKAPIRWAERVRFTLASVQDEHTRRKLEQNPGLVREIRECRPDNALRFLSIVYGDYIDAGLMYQTDLAGQKRTATNPSPRPALDKRLFDLCAAQCADGAKRLSAYLPTTSQRVDRELERFDAKEINRMQAAMTRRKTLKKKNAPDSAHPG